MFFHPEIADVVSAKTPPKAMEWSPLPLLRKMSIAWRHFFMDGFSYSLSSAGSGNLESNVPGLGDLVFNFWVIWCLTIETRRHDGAQTE